MTNGEMKAEVAGGFGLQSLADFNETIYVQQLLNRGVIDLLSRTRCVVRCTEMHLTAGVQNYTLDHAIISIVDFGEGSERTRRNGRHYDPSFTLIRSDILQLSPSPDEDGEVSIWAVRMPGAMSADEDDPGAEQFGAIPPEFHDAIVMYAKWWAADYADDSGSQNGERYRQQYEGRIREIKTLVNKRGTARAPRSRGKHLRRVAPRHAWVD